MKIDYTKLFSYSLTKVCGLRDCVGRISFLSSFVWKIVVFIGLCGFFVKYLEKNGEIVAFYLLL